MPTVLPDSLLRKARRFGSFINGLVRVSPKYAGRVMFRIMCLPRHRPFKAIDKTFLDTADIKHLFANNLRIRCYTWPHPTLQAAPKVLLAHGWESHSGRWRDYVPALHAAGFSVVAFDAPAHGNSDGKLLNGILYGQAVADLMPQLGDIYAYVGHSMGGTAILIALTRMQMTPPQKIIIMGAPTNIQRITDELCQLFALSPAAKKAIYDHIAVFSGRPITDLILHEKVSGLGHIPVFIMHDTEDDVAPIAEGRMLAANWPNATFLETTGLGHRFLPPAQAIKEIVSRL